MSFVIENGVLKQYLGKDSHVEIPNGVKSIGYNAFKNCDFIESLYVPESLTSFGSVGDTVVNLKAVHISNIATWLNMDFGNRFQNPLLRAGQLYLNGSLVTELVIPKGITEIKNFAFFGCSSLKKVIIPEGVTTIGDVAFGNCENLEEIDIPETLVSVKDGFLDHKSGVRRINISNVEAWMNIDFRTNFSNPLVYAHNLYLNGAPVTDVIIPGSIETVNAFAFMGCHTLKTVTVSPGIRKIGGSSFAECVNLVSVKIPESVTSIEWAAFKDCHSLTINVPDTVKSVGKEAFSGVKSRGDLVLNPASVTVLPNEYYDIRPTLLTICDRINSELHTSDKEPVYLLSKFYEKEVFEQILNESREWYIASYHSEGSDYGYSSSYSDDSEDYYEIPYNKIVVENGHFAGIAEFSDFSAYMKGTTSDKSLEIALIKSWEGKPLKCAHFGDHFSSDDHERWNTTTHYLCKKNN